MKSSLLLSGFLLSCFICSGMEQPGAKTICGTNVTYKASSVRFAGDALTMNLWKTGNEIVFTKQQIRLGGTNLLINGKIATRKNFSVENDGQVCYTFDNTPETTETYSLQKDGGIEYSIVSTAKRAQINFGFISEYFFGSAIIIDGKRFEIAQHKSEEKFYNEFWNSSANNIIFFPDSPEKQFEIIPYAGTRVKLIYSAGKYGLSIQLSGSGNSASGCVIVPGKKLPGKGKKTEAAGKYLTRVGSYDFWNEDRLRLPDLHEKNLLRNNSFEQGMTSLYFHHYTSGGFYSENLWNAKPYQISGDQAFHGKYSLRIESDSPSRCIRSAIATHPVILTPGEYVFSLYAKSTIAGEQTLIVNQPDLPPGANIFSRKTWKEYRFSLTKEWKRFSFPVHITGVQPQFFVLSATSASNAFCYVDAMQLERGKTLSAYVPASVEGRLVTDAPGNFLEYGKAANAFLELTSAPETEGSVKVTVRDFFGSVKLEKEYPFQTDSSGKGNVSLPLDHFPRGIFVIENNYRLKNGSSRYEFLRFSVMSFLENKHRHKNLFSNAYIDPYGNFQNYREVLERYRKIGIGSRSGIASNDALTNLEGLKFGVDPVSSWVTRVKAGSIRGGENAQVTLNIPENIVWYGVPSKKNHENILAEITLPCNTPEAFQQYSQGAEKLAAASPWIQAWSNLGEAEGCIPDFAHSDYASNQNFQNYVDFEVAVAQGLKRGNPKAMIGTSATSCLRKDRIENLDKFLTLVGKRFHYDCFFIHTYREAPEYPDLDSDFQQLFEMLARHGYIKEPVICSEGMHWKPYKMKNLIFPDWIATPWGPFSYDMGDQERLASAWRARHWLIGLKHQDRIKVMNSSTNFWGFEMDPDLTPFATQKISNTLGRILGNATFKEEVKLSKKVRCYLFEDEKSRPVAVVWSCDPEIDKGLKEAPELLLHKLPSLTMFDLMEKDSVWAGGELKLKLSPYPVFLRGNPGSTEKILDVLKHAELRIKDELSATTSFCVVSPSEGTFITVNGNLNEFKAEWNINGKISTVVLPPGETEKIKVKLPVQLSTEKISFEDFSIPVRQILPYPASFTLRETFYGVLAKHIKSPVRIDGSLDEWKGIPRIPVSSRMAGPYWISKGLMPSAANFSADMQIAWDKTHLYVAVEVRDDRFVVNKLPLCEGWKNDSLQIYLDTFCDARAKKATVMDDNDYSYGFYFEKGNTAPKPWLHHVPDMQLTGGTMAVKKNTVSPYVKTAWKKTDNGYIYEIAFSAQGIRPFKLEAGKALGFGLMLNDQDGMSVMPASHLILGGPDNPNRSPQSWPLVLLVE